MFVVEGQVIDADMRNQAEIDAVIRELEGDGYQPLLRTMLRAGVEVAKTPFNTQLLPAVLSERQRASGDSARPVGDALFKDDRVYVITSARTSIAIWAIRHHLAASGMQDFCDTLEASARKTLDGRRLRGMSFARSVRSVSLPSVATTIEGRLQELQLEITPATYEPIDVERACQMLPTQQRSFLVGLAQVGKARSIDTASGAQPQETDVLAHTGLIRKEYLVVCRKDSRTLCSVEDRSQIDGQDGRILRCPTCGKSFSDELIYEIYALTEAAKTLLDGSRWMTIWLTDLLVSAGIQRNNIGWNAIAGEDELDVLADVAGVRVFFELRDREFGLGDAYPFVYRVARYGGSYGVVISMDRVADEAKKFLKEQTRSVGRVPIEVLEGREHAEERMPTLVEQFSRLAVNRAIRDLDESLAVTLRPILRAWMDRSREGTGLQNG